jgi:hypothetical protein
MGREKNWESTMKLRIRGNSVRLRLNQTEVARLAAGERVEQATQFSPTSSLLSSIERAAGEPAPRATFDGRRLAVYVPDEQVRRWADSDQVGIAADQSFGGENPLRLLIEKDYECLHSRAEGDADAFPNPRMHAAESSTQIPPAPCTSTAPNDRSRAWP